MDGAVSKPNGTDFFVRGRGNDKIRQVIYTDLKVRVHAIALWAQRQASKFQYNAYRSKRWKHERQMSSFVGHPLRICSVSILECMVSTMKQIIMRWLQLASSRGAAATQKSIPPVLLTYRETYLHSKWYTRYTLSWRKKICDRFLNRLKKNVSKHTFTIPKGWNPKEKLVDTVKK